ncbi:methyltransferase family protein [Wenxinia saemankumensis]|uniref:Protein-S-isoprenylcysteine O-methyltransferase Ste14 n=1 Tax=Wenxinia saemankumensis TaxID=1447782 RepID=A0A1M6CJZ9_9RHOB|nr:isoprenylcysteine carboxylmethyltransferase family protein [Wenxinia saemankumensis]SHI61345.1 Protein-S-isoprenylcysteine O-methyltransferase Ste14 [Wenxinia saemankumensis]
MSAAGHLRGFPDLPPVWALGTLALQWALARWLPVVRLEAPSAALAGWLFVALGLALILWSALWFRRQATPIMPRETPRRLIAAGPFRLNRNPIYTGMALALAGTGLLLGALGAILAVLPFLWIIDRRFVRGEEAGLRAAFGAEAERYIAQTRRW